MFISIMLQAGLFGLSTRVCLWCVGEWICCGPKILSIGLELSVWIHGHFKLVWPVVYLTLMCSDP